VKLGGPQAVEPGKPSQATIPLPIPAHALLPFRRRYPGAGSNSFRIHRPSLPRIPQSRADVPGLPLTFERL